MCKGFYGSLISRLSLLHFSLHFTPATRLDFRPAERQVFPIHLSKTLIILLMFPPWDFAHHLKSCWSLCREAACLGCQLCSIRYHLHWVSVLGKMLTDLHLSNPNSASMSWINTSLFIFYPFIGFQSLECVVVVVNVINCVHVHVHVCAHACRLLFSLFMQS